ncbi:MAG: ATP synthase subunit I [Clostridia bacterium]|nr:ATP synthase subunit I [Clostridia bacterium]
MTIQPAVKQETKKIAVGVCLLSVLMVGVYLIIGRFSLPVLFGALLGAAFAVFNFFLMALSVQQAAEKMNGVQLPPEEESAEDAPSDENAKAELSPQAKQARRNMQLSYTGRMALLVAMAAIAYFAPGIDAVPALLAQLFPRLTIFIEGILLKKETQAQ